MNSFHSAISGAFDALHCAAGETITYHMGDEWFELSGVAGNTILEITDNSGFLIEQRSRDWIVKACELNFNGAEVTPNRGHLIKHVVGDKQNVFEVSRPDGNEQVWRHMDAGQTQLRIHTKLKEVVDV